MKTILLILFFAIAIDVNAQVIDYSEKQEAAIPLNLDEVTKMLEYPNIASETKLEGDIKIKVLVDTLGNVEKTGDIMGPDVFYDEVKRVAVFLKFTPAKLAGKLVPAWFTIPFTFKLPKN